MAEVKIYCLSDPRDPENIRYVGKTKKSLEFRLGKHLSHRNGKSPIRVARWIRSLGEITPIISLIEIVDELVWKEKETFWIKHYRFLGFDLCNLTDGGDGVHNPSIESRFRLSEATKRNMADPKIREKIFTLERNKKISQSLTGRKHSKVHISKLPQNRKGSKRKLSEEQRRVYRENAIEMNKTRNREPVSEETRLKLSKAAKGRVAWNKGIPQNEESNQKRSLTTKGRSLTDEHRQKLKEAAILRWQKQKER